MYATSCMYINRSSPSRQHTTLTRSRLFRSFTNTTAWFCAMVMVFPQVSHSKLLLDCSSMSAKALKLKEATDMRGPQARTLSRRRMSRNVKCYNFRCSTI